MAPVATFWLGTDGTLFTLTFFERVDYGHLFISLALVDFSMVTSELSWLVFHNSK